MSLCELQLTAKVTSSKQLFWAELWHMTRKRYLCSKWEGSKDRGTSGETQVFVLKLVVVLYTVFTDSVVYVRILQCSTGIVQGSTVLYYTMDRTCMGWTICMVCAWKFQLQTY